LIITFTGLLFVFLIGMKILPKRENNAFLDELPLREYITELLVTVDSSIINKTVNEWEPQRIYGIEVLGVRDDKQVYLPSDNKVVRAGDFLWVRGPADAILKIQRADHMVIPAAPLSELQEKTLLESGDVGFVEAVIAPTSKLVGMTVHEANTMDLNNVTILAIRRRGRVLRQSLADAILESGDCVLVQGHQDSLYRLRSDIRFLLLEPLKADFVHKTKIPIALSIMAAVIIVSAINLFPIVFAALSGALLMVVTGCINPKEAYDSINWKVLIMIGCLIPLGYAMEASGAATLMTEKIISVAGPLGPIAILSGLYLVTMLLTEVISNAACLVLMFPFAVTIASQLDISAKPFVMAVTFASTLSFMTPVGYQTNTIIYGIGGYKFKDFFRLGIPLAILCWGLATLLIPMIWKF